MSYRTQEDYPKMKSESSRIGRVETKGMDGEIRSDLPSYETSGKKAAPAREVSGKVAKDPKISPKVK